MECLAAIGHGLAVGDVHERLPDPLLERGPEVDIQRKAKDQSPAREVLLELKPDVLKGPVIPGSDRTERAQAEIADRSNDSC